LENPSAPDSKWDNRTILVDAIDTMGQASSTLFDQDG